VQKTPQPQGDLAEKPQKLPDEDQYLDIPAFLRRQAN
jgi:cell division protein FtsZ